MQGAICTSLMRFKHIEPHPHRDSKVYRLLIHEFGVVRLDRTFSNSPLEGVQGAICTSLMRLSTSNLLEPISTDDIYMKGNIQLL